MCYSRSWYEEAERKAREAKAREADEKRTQTVRDLMSEAEKEAEQARRREVIAREAAPAK
jgi:hypothetical protein